jgi:urease accessory protein
MVVITSSRIEVSPDALRSRERDTLRLTWEERRWTRKRVTSSGGREVALALPTGSMLEPGAILAVEEDWYLAVEGCPEPVLVVTPRDHAEAVRIAFEVGNRHAPLALDGPCLLVPDDSAMEQLVSRVGVRWERRRAVFVPLGLGHRHADGASPDDTHAQPESDRPDD